MNGPYAIGSAHWPGVSKLNEECGEVVQVIGKLIGTGGETRHWDGTDLRVRLQEEIADVLAAAQFVDEFCGLDSAAINKRVQEKYRQFVKYHAAGDPAPEGK